MATKPLLESYYLNESVWEGDRYRNDASQCMRARVVASLLDSSATSVLDVGCGNGFVTGHLTRHSVVVGCDPSEVALRCFDGPRVLATAEALPFQDRSFDATVCLEVLEHLSPETFRRAVAELDRVTRTTLVIGVPCREDLRCGMTRCSACGTTYHVDLHQRSFSGPQDICGLFPAFEREAEILMGQRVETRSGLYRWFRYQLMGPEASSSFARCPSCAAEGASHSERQHGRRIRRWFLRNLDWRMSRRTVSRWIIVVLRRAGKPAA